MTNIQLLVLFTFIFIWTCKKTNWNPLSNYFNMITYFNLNFKKLERISLVDNIKE